MNLNQKSRRALHQGVLNGQWTGHKGGTVSITGGGDILFTPDASFTGVMSFKYTIADNTNQVTNVINSATGQTELMKAAVYLQTGDLPSDPLAVEQWYLTDTNVISAWGTQAEIANNQGYSGKGIRIGQFEPGGPFSTGPEVFDYRHPDLAPNADKTVRKLPTTKYIAHCAHSMPANNRFGLKKNSKWIRRSCIAEVPSFKLYQRSMRSKG